MSSFLKCLAYLAALSIASFVLGRLMPKNVFKCDCFPFKAFAFENGGKIYTKIGIRKWKNKLPDMSKIFSRLMPSKRLPDAATSVQIEIMLRETCVAEQIHKLLAVFGFVCIRIWKGIGGITVSVLYAAVNIMYVVIQRYNRPKLMTVFERLRQNESDFAVSR
ncbi:MAG: glycosyl-4,4'-diaponeurosporenoate acyltransferase [Firmicutes bacterium]|nr:glycosyl-4,4'-diaponeurosporenoate acyltransferase [Bacillota bacterium]